MVVLRALLFCVLAINAFACGLCSVYSPTAHVQTYFETNATSIKAIKFTWSFSENFSQLMRTNFDLDASGNIEKNELTQIRRSLLDYIVPRKFLTKIEHYNKGEEATLVAQNVRDYELYFDAGRMKFDIVFNVDIALRRDLVISVEAYDEEGYFAFRFFEEGSHELSSDLFAVPNLNSNIAFYTLSDVYAAKEYDAKPSLSSLLAREENKNLAQDLSASSQPAQPQKALGSQSIHDEIDAIDEAKFNAISRAGIGFLDRLRELLRAGSQGFSASAFALLLAVSFAYGFLHAAGAGHGKLLTAAYFAATGGSYARAAIFALRIGVLHVIGAAGFVGAMFALLSAVSTAYVKDAGRITTSVSAVIIIAVASFMLYKGLKFRGVGAKFSPNLNPHKIYPPQNLNLARTKLNFSHEEGCGCAACEFSAWQEAKNSGKNLDSQNFKPNLKAAPVNAREWLVAAAAALVPCPGTILVFTLAFELGSWGAGFASGVMMALGMSAVIFVAAVFGAKINAGANARVKMASFYAQIIACTVMLGLGAFILISNFGKASAF